MEVGARTKYSRRTNVGALEALHCLNGYSLLASLGCHSLQVWRLILDGLKALKHGLIKRINDGNYTHVWNENSLPQESMMRPIAPFTPNQPEIVHELIDVMEMKWNDHILERILCQWR